MKICPVCKKKSWKYYLRTYSDTIITGDQRITEGNLDKVICNICGTVTNRLPFTVTEIKKLYGEEYELNTHGREEHVFYTENGPNVRSQVFANWIAPFITNESKVITEIGCGEGLFIEKMKRMFPLKKFSGIDGSKKAVKLAHKKKLNVEKKLIMSSVDTIQKSDIIILINVIEHVEDINGTIEALKKSINNNGRLIFCLPIQEYGGYDILFAEHVWHFTTDQFINVLKNNGLKIIHNDSNHKINHGIGLFVCEINCDDISTTSIKNNKERMLEIRNFWLNSFGKLEQEIITIKNSRVAIFGSGELFTLFYAYSKLSSINILKCIDETPGKAGTKKHGLKIVDISWLSENSIDVIIICTNKKYYNQIKKKLNLFKIKKYIEVYQ